MAEHSLPPGVPHYKVRLDSGRVLGPLDLERVRQFIRKGHIIGVEQAREYPAGDWRPINEIPELASLLLAQAEGRLVPRKTRPDPVATGPMLPGSEASGSLVLGVSPEEVMSVPLEIVSDAQALPAVQSQDPEKTYVAGMPETSAPADPEATVVGALPATRRPEGASSSVSITLAPDLGVIDPSVAREATVVIELPKKKKNKLPFAGFVLNDRVRKGAVAIMLLLLAQELLTEAPKPPVTNAPAKAVRPRLPQANPSATPNPQKAQKAFVEGRQLYVRDTLPDYASAAEKFLESLKDDPDNVRALALLASSYLNLIDTSLKDENYFSVISKLIELSRAKSLDLGETVIADTEFYLVTQKAEAAYNRIVEYTRTHPKNVDAVMLYFISLSLFSKGEWTQSATYLSNIADTQVFTPRIFFLRGQLAEKLGQPDAAVAEYRKAIKMNPFHERSRLRISELLVNAGKIKEAAPDLQHILEHPNYLASKELARAHFLQSQIYQVLKKWDFALGAVEKALKLDPENQDYLLEVYSQRAKAGDDASKMRNEARMYFYLGEGERILKGGNSHEALIQFLLARKEAPEAAIPHVKIGDMFMLQNDLINARESYQKATVRAPKDLRVWAKYIDTLVRSYEWSDAEAAMKRVRELGIGDSTMDKAAGDMYARQKRYPDAQVYYKKAMSRETIDPDVYISYANSLYETKNYADAPFFYSLALRFDPTNRDALIGIAKTVAASEGIDKGIARLQDELQKLGGSKPEFLAAIAELNIQRGEWSEAQRYVDQAMQADPSYAYPWKLQAQIFQNKDGLEKDALDRALAAYQSFSDRSRSDVSGYLTRYQIFIKKGQFEKAKEELDKIFGIYPRYPNLHYYKGLLYSIMGNHKVAAEEFMIELRNNPNNPMTMVALAREQIDMGAPKEAQELLNKAMGIAPKSADVRFQAGRASFALKQFHGAVALLTSALNFDKGNPAIYKELGRTYQAMGDPTGARQNFRKYLEMEPDAPDKAEFQQFL